MKRKILVVLIVLLGLSFILPSISSARAGRFHGRLGYYRHYGWHRPHVYVGTAFVAPWYVIVPPPAYIYAPPVAPPAPVVQPAYAYPDPEFIAKHKDNNPPGEWVAVPGQWVDGKWVPAHKVWVPVNP